MRDDAEMRQGLAGQTAPGRVGEPEEIGDAIATLASESLRWMTAQRIEVSGAAAVRAIPDTGFPHCCAGTAASSPIERVVSDCLGLVMQLVTEHGGVEGRSLVEVFCRTDLDQAAGQASIAW